MSNEKSKCARSRRPTPTVLSTYDGANQLLTSRAPAGTTTYTYDADGNRTRQNAPATLTDYTWDEDNRLTKAEPVAGDVDFTYNADGNRVKKQTPTETTKFIYDFKHLLEETDGAGALDTLYTTTDGEYGDLISEYDSTGDHYPMYDAQWSADALIDGTEGKTDQYKYRAFGLQLNPSPGPTESPYQFVAKQGYYQDNEIDLYYLGSGGNGRPYDPATGQFILPDRIEDDTNAYRYVRNKPPCWQKFPRSPNSWQPELLPVTEH